MCIYVSRSVQGVLIVLEAHAVTIQILVGSVFWCEPLIYLFMSKEPQQMLLNPYQEVQWHGGGVQNY